MDFHQMNTPSNQHWDPETEHYKNHFMSLLVTTSHHLLRIGTILISNSTRWLYLFLNHT